MQLPSSAPSPSRSFAARTWWDRAEELCHRRVVVARKDDPLSHAAELMRDNHVGDGVVIEYRGSARIPVGIVTGRDIVVGILAQEVAIAHQSPAAVGGDHRPQRVAPHRDQRGFGHRLQNDNRGVVGHGVGHQQPAAAEPDAVRHVSAEHHPTSGERLRERVDGFQVMRPSDADQREPRLRRRHPVGRRGSGPTGRTRRRLLQGAGRRCAGFSHPFPLPTRANMRPIHVPELGDVITLPQVGGLHHKYVRRIAQ
ncbi:MAG: CBS domain-containing protein [Myxococcota bacterium]